MTACATRLARRRWRVLGAQQRATGARSRRAAPRSMTSGARRRRYPSAERERPSGPSYRPEPKHAPACAGGPGGVLSGTKEAPVTEIPGL